MSGSGALGHFGFVPFKGRNSLLDSMFYDVDALTQDEKLGLSPLTDREGTVLLVYPAKTGKSIEHYRNALQLLLHKKDEVCGIAVAGVGSSVLGTAALARNVADAIEGPVAGIVSGYGVSDLMSEALGGWYFFGAIDRSKYKAEQAMASLVNGSVIDKMSAGVTGSELDRTNAMLDGLPLQSDTTAMLDLLESQPPNLRWLVGHSKGCLMIDYVLERYARAAENRHSKLYQDLHVVTLGAVVSLPKKFKHVTQLIGMIDNFGKMNSTLTVDHREIERAWHHLNRSLPFHFDAVDAMKRLVQGKTVGVKPKGFAFSPLELPNAVAS